MRYKFKQQPDGSWKARCYDTQWCFGCVGEVTLPFNPSWIVNYKEIRAPEEKDYEMGLFNVVTTEEFEKRTLKEYVESKEQWYYFHDFICDEDRICVFQILVGNVAAEPGTCEACKKYDGTKPKNNRCAVKGACYNVGKRCTEYDAR